MMAKALYIIAQDGFQDHEFSASKAELDNAGHEITVASFSTDIAKGTFGSEVKPDITLDDVNADDYDLVTIIGGGGMIKLVQDQTIINIVKDMKTKGKIISAICIAPMLLANAGVLQGKKATVYETPESVKALQDGGAEFTGESVTVDGDTITGNGPPAAEEFGKKLVEALS